MCFTVNRYVDKASRENVDGLVFSLYFNHLIWPNMLNPLSAANKDLYNDEIMFCFVL